MIMFSSVVAIADRLGSPFLGCVLEKTEEAEDRGAYCRWRVRRPKMVEQPFLPSRIAA